MLLGLLALCGVFIWRASVFIRRRDAEREAEAEMRHHAYHDTLTGLPNRLSFKQTLDAATAMAGKAGKQVGVMFLDLDRFKLVNDSLGHDAGDDLLKEVASRVKHSLREQDRLFRMGGDEFTIIVYGLNSRQEIEKVAERVLRAFAAPFLFEGREFMLSTSIGIAMSADDGASHDDLLKRADAAMYQAKAGGRNRYAFYSADIDSAAGGHLELEFRLQKAFDEKQFFLCYQPRIATDTGRVVGCEALLRWRSADGTTVMPADFVASLEDSGLIVPVGRWVLQEACAQARSWQRQGLSGIRMSVNVSAVQFVQDDFVADVCEVLQATGLDARYLELEITENVLLQGVERVTRTLSELKQMGVCVSIDDFGTGYSSLSYLRSFAIDYIKIDQSFVEGVAGNEQNASITRAIAALASSLGMKYVAEGVETQAESDFLRGIGCQEMQGFLFSAPVSADAVAEILRQQATDRNATAPEPAGSGRPTPDPASR